MMRLLKINIPLATPSAYIARFCGQLGLNGVTQSRVKELLSMASDKGLICGRSPVAIVGALIYIASLQTREKRTQAEIANIANVTEVTIRNRYKELKSVLDLENFNKLSELNIMEMEIPLNGVS